MPGHGYRDTLEHRGLQPFLWTQFLGAFNDNLFKIVVSMVAVHAATSANSGRQLSIVGAVFILPFLLFSGYAGQLADVYSKRTVLVVTKSLEIVAAALWTGCVHGGRLEITYAVLFLIALQATFFSPAKYGILPEILPDRDLSRANGVLEMSTFVAIVAGTAAGSFMFDAWRDRLWLVGVVVLVVAVAGTVLSFRIPHVAPAAPGKKIDPNPWGEIVSGRQATARGSGSVANSRRHFLFLVSRLPAAARRDSVWHRSHGTQRSMGRPAHDIRGTAESGSAVSRRVGFQGIRSNSVWHPSARSA
mgnify:CR=1 FL=1